MTVANARKILGHLAETMTNDQIQTIIDSFSGIIEIGFQLFEKNEPKSASIKKNLES